MRRLTLVVLAVLLLVGAAFSVALAANPHFVGQVQFEDLGNQFQVSGSIAGLGNQNIDVKVTATGRALVECTNPGGKVAPGQTKNITVSGSQTDLEVKNGRVNFSVTTGAPATPTDACPNPKWSAAIVDVIFDSVTVTVYQPAGSGIVVLQETFTP